MNRSPSDHPWRGRSVLITGASSGVGAALAEILAAEGARPALMARDKARLAETSRRCKALGGEAVTVVGDVTVPADCAAAVEAADGDGGGLDIAIACAGLSMWTRFDELEDPATLRRIMDVNYGGLVNTAFHALPHLKRSRGQLVVISSIQGYLGVPFHTGYSASKHAVQGFCDSLRMELRGTGVGILTVIAHWIQGTKLREHALGPDGCPQGSAPFPHGSGAVPVADMVRAIMRGMQARRRTLFVPAKLRYLTWLVAVAPPLAEAIVRRRVYREHARRGR